MSKHNRDDDPRDDPEAYKFQKESQKFDQGAAFLGDALPALWWRMYNNMLLSGFSEEQAMSLLRTYVKAACQPTPPKE